MAVYEGIDQLLNGLQKDINKVMDVNGEVAEEVKKIMREHVITDVYNAYPEPFSYVRRRDAGGLSDIDNIKVVKISDGIELINETKDSEGNKWITPIVESGKGYDHWRDSFARPFNKNTQEELDRGKSKEIIIKSLKKKGWNID